MKQHLGPNLLLAAASSLCMATYGLSPSDFQESLFATSNVWGTAISSYEGSVAAVVDIIPLGAGSHEALVEWYSRLTFYDESPGQSKSGDWAFEKGRMLHKFSRNNVIAHSTNAWMSAAGCLARMRHTRRSLTFNVQGALSLTNLTGYASSEWNAIIDERVDTAFAMSNLRIGIDKAIPLIEEVVTNGFPRAILPSLEESIRSTVVSNVAETAEIDVSAIWKFQGR